MTPGDITDLEDTVVIDDRELWPGRKADLPLEPEPPRPPRGDKEHRSDGAIGDGLPPMILT